MSSARRTRKPSEKRASMNRKVTARSRRVGSRAGEIQRKRAEASLLGRCCIGSFKAPHASRKGGGGGGGPAGIAAIQKTARMSWARAIIRPTAASGASSAPTVSSACLGPNARPRIPGGVSSAMIASRVAPRMPHRAGRQSARPSVLAAPSAIGNRGFDKPPGRSPGSTHGLRLRLRSDSRPDASLAKLAVASATPSIAPSASAGGRHGDEHRQARGRSPNSSPSAD